MNSLYRKKLQNYSGCHWSPIFSLVTDSWHCSIRSFHLLHGFFNTCHLLSRTLVKVEWCTLFLSDRLFAMKIIKKYELHSNRFNCLTPGSNLSFCFMKIWILQLCRFNALLRMKFLWSAQTVFRSISIEAGFSSEMLSFLLVRTTGLHRRPWLLWVYSSVPHDLLSPQCSVRGKSSCSL